MNRSDLNLSMPTLAAALSLSAALVCGGGSASPAHARQQAQKRPLPAVKTAPARKATTPAPGKKPPVPAKARVATKKVGSKVGSSPVASHHRLGLANLGRLTPNATASNSSLRLTSKLDSVGKTGTSPLDRWSMTRQKQTARSWKKANERDNRGRSVLPPP